MSWRPLSEWVRPLWQAARRLPPEATADLREAGARVAVATHGMADVAARPALVNLGALAVAARARLVVHALRAGVARAVADTDLHALPAEPPALLRGAWLVEAQHADRGEVLWGDTACLAGYPLDGAVYLVGLPWPDGVRVAAWRPRWTGEDVAAGVAAERSPLIDDVDAHHAWAREAARYAAVLALLLEAEASPLRARDEPEARGRRGPARSVGDAEAWVTRHVYVGAASGPSARDAGEEPAPARAEGRSAVEVPVRGHLKRQRHGPGNARVKWIYVAGFSARRWVGPKPVRVVV